MEMTLLMFQMLINLKLTIKVITASISSKIEPCLLIIQGLHLRRIRLILPISNLTKKKKSQTWVRTEEVYCFLRL